MANARNPEPDPPKMILLPGEWSLRPESVLSRVAYELLWRVLGSGLRPPAAEVRTIDAAYSSHLGIAQTENKSAFNRRPAEVRVDSA